MKKILTGIIALFLFNAATIAQAVKKAPLKTADSKMKVVTAKTVTTSKVVPMPKTTVAATKTTTTSSKVVLKKDGTPDKRYTKTTTTAVPLKKDGTPDKRFKINKKN